MSPKKLLVLISDDDPLVLSSISRQFQKHDAFEVVIDGNSNAVAVAQKRIPDLIVLDLNQPVFGLKMLVELQSHKETKEIPVVVMSAICDRKMRDACLQAGARAFVTKPLEKEFMAVAERLASLRKSQAQPGSASKATILVVDDSSTVLDITRDVLEDAGYVVHTTDNPFLLGTVLRRHQPDMVLIDLKMPGLSGDEAVQVVGSSIKGIPVFLYSGAPPEELKQAASRVGAAGFICKTSDAKVLMREVARCLAQSRVGA